MRRGGVGGWESGRGREREQQKEDGAENADGDTRTLELEATKSVKIDSNDVVWLHTHLNEWPIRPYDLDDNHHGDADHGGQGQSPTYSHSPVRILVDLVVRQWLVFDQREDKAALKEDERLRQYKFLAAFKAQNLNPT